MPIFYIQIFAHSTCGAKTCSVVISPGSNFIGGIRVGG